MNVFGPFGPFDPPTIAPDQQWTSTVEPADWVPREGKYVERIEAITAERDALAEELRMLRASILKAWRTGQKSKGAKAEAFLNQPKAAAR